MHNVIYARTHKSLCDFSLVSYSIFFLSFLSSIIFPVKHQIAQNLSQQRTEFSSGLADQKNILKQQTKHKKVKSGNMNYTNLDTFEVVSAALLQKLLFFAFVLSLPRMRLFYKQCAVLGV